MGSCMVASRPQAGHVKAYHSAKGRADWSTMVSPAASHTGQATVCEGSSRHTAMRCSVMLILSAGSADDTGETLSLTIGHS